MDTPQGDRSAALLVHSLTEIRSEFAQVRGLGKAIRAFLIQEASNALVEGVAEFPLTDYAKVDGCCSAGFRNFGSRRDPLPADAPVVDIDGIPLLNADGSPMAVQMPATRIVYFVGDAANCGLRNAAERAGRILTVLPEAIEVLSEWSFMGPEDRWWAILFETAWSNRHPILRADRKIWQVVEKRISFFPYCLEQLNMLNQQFLKLGTSQFAEKWLKRLPDAYFSEIKDAADASVHLADQLIHDLQPRSDFPQAVLENSAEPTTKDGNMLDPVRAACVRAIDHIIATILDGPPGQELQWVPQLTPNLSEMTKSLGYVNIPLEFDVEEVNGWQQYGAKVSHPHGGGSTVLLYRTKLAGKPGDPVREHLERSEYHIEPVQRESIVRMLRAWRRELESPLVLNSDPLDNSGSSAEPLTDRLTNIANSLTDRQRTILRELFGEKAFNRDSLLRTNEIARLCSGPQAHPNAFKQPLAELAMTGLTESRTGRGGGIWLSPLGKEVAAHLSGAS